MLSGLGAELWSELDAVRKQEYHMTGYLSKGRKIAKAEAIINREAAVTCISQGRETLGHFWALDNVHV